MRLAPVFLATVLLAAAAVGPAAATQETVTLTVTAVNDGATVGGVTLNATWDGGWNTATTASNGKAFLDVPEGADVEIHVEDETYVRNFPKTVENAEGEDVTVEVSRKGSLRVTVTGSEGTLEGVDVTLVRDGRVVTSGTTNADGAYRTGAIERGTYTVRLFEPGYFRKSASVTVTGDVFADLELERGTVNIEIRVRDPHFSPPEPVNDAQVSVESIGTQRTTAGTVTFTVPVNGEYRVNVTKAEYRTASRVVEVAESPLNLTLSIRRERELVARPVNERVVVGETVLVDVVNAYGEPVANATVSIDGETAGETNAEGEVRVRVETPGEHTIRARAGGIRSAAAVVTGVAVRASPTSSPTSSPTPSPSPTEPRTPAPTESPTPGTDTPLPGFGLPAALVALLLAGLAARR